MKKLLCLIIILLSLIIVISHELSAETSAGIAAWYMKWVFNGKDEVKIPPAFMYGPAVSVKFADNWSLAGLFLYGKFMPENLNNEFSRYDSDISLSCNFNNYIKIFGGCKILAFTWEGNGKTLEHWSVGPGLGVGAALPVPIINDLFFIINASGIYAKGNHENTNNPNSPITESGFNSTTTLTYFIVSASTSINIGFRYQYIYTDYQKEKKANGDNSDAANYYYGATITVVYRF